jgi:hypothetical protein
MLIPQISNFAKAVTDEVAAQEIDREDFDAAVDAAAVKVPCPRLSSATLAAEYLNDEILGTCNAPEYPDAELNAMAATLMQVCDEFRAGFAYYHLNSLCREIHKARERAAQDDGRDYDEPAECGQFYDGR